MSSSLVRTGATMTAIFGTMLAYILQLYGAYTAQQANLHSGASGDIDAGYIVSGAFLNLLVTVYLLYCLFGFRFEKHGELFKSVGAFLLIAGLIIDIFLAVYVLNLVPATVDKQIWESYGWIYTISSFNFLARLFYVIQFQCSDVHAPKVRPAEQLQPNPFKKPFVQQQQQRPDRGPNPFVKPEEGGKSRRRRR